MKFEKKGNLGKTDLLLHHISLKKMKSEDGSILLSEDEVNEIKEHLENFRHLMSNVNLHKNSLADNQYNALVSVIDELGKYYKDYE